jgi:hypothetical protein
MKGEPSINGCEFFNSSDTEHPAQMLTGFVFYKTVDRADIVRDSLISASDTRTESLRE